VGLSGGIRIRPQEVFVVHANASLSERGRFKLARLVVDKGWPVASAAARFHLSWPTAKRWADRYRAEGPPEWPITPAARTRPHHSPNATPPAVVRRVAALRWRRRLGPVVIASEVAVSPSTMHWALTRCRINRLSHIDRTTGEPVRRYENIRWW
jgi:hypothetical protein